MLKKVGIVVLLLAIFLLLVKRKNMTWKQSVVRAIYPLFILKDKLFGNSNSIMTNSGQRVPTVSFYSLQAKSGKGETIDFATLKGKQVLVVNSASDCGYTPQYEELEALHQKYPQLVILIFPANDFKQQEKKGDAEIEQFCKINYGLTIPLMSKVSVVKGPEQHPVFQWLSDAGQNGWCKSAPVWNFSKYLINREGVLTHFFRPSVSPMSEDFIRLIEL
ncbi:MAG: glutathione peroxidase [Sediminibacterium sp.]|jgi:glutathione peroxidase